MKKPVTVSEIYNFDSPVVYIYDGDNKIIGYILMFNEEDAKEIREYIDGYETYKNAFMRLTS